VKLPAFIQRGLVRLARASLENPSTPIDDPDDWLYEAFGGGSSSGVKVNRQTILRYGPVWRGVTLIAGSVGKLPLISYKRVGEGKDRAIDHSAYRLLKRRPNREMTAFTFKQTLMGHAILQGNGYAYIFRRGDGSPEELIPLNPEETFPVRVNGELMYVTKVGAETRKLLPQNVLHIKGFSFEGLQGYSLIDKARDSLSVGIAAGQYGSRFFRNSARPSVVIEHPGKLGPEAKKNLRDSWETMHAGLENMHRTAVLDEGMKVQAFSINARDAQLLETRQFEIREVANWLGLPPHKLGDSSRTAYNSLEQENQSYLDDALDPWLVNWEEECVEKLLTEDEKDNDTHTIEFTRQALVRANLLQRFQAYQIAINTRVMNPNEVRARENLNPYEGGDEFLVPLNMGQPAADTLDGGDGTDTLDGSDSTEKSDTDPQRTDTHSAATTAVRAMLADVVRRMVKRISTHARKQARKPETFTDWLDDEMSDEHRPVFVEAMSPVIGAIAAICGRQDTPESWATDLLGDLAKRLGATTETATAAQLAGAVGTAMSAAEAELPSIYANRLTEPQGS
jgi:HK97 family phage portal protein